jgi:hypothetical protein
MLDPKELKKKEAVIKKMNKNYATVSIIDDASMKELTDALNKFVKKSIKPIKK